MLSLKSLKNNWVHRKYNIEEENRKKEKKFLQSLGFEPGLSDSQSSVITTIPTCWHSKVGKSAIFKLPADMLAHFVADRPKLAGFDLLPNYSVTLNKVKV